MLDPHSAIAYLGLSAFEGPSARVFLATAHPAKFAEIVEPIVHRTVEKPAPLAQALSGPRHIIRIGATDEAVRGALRA